MKSIQIFVEELQDRLKEIRCPAQIETIKGTPHLVIYIFGNPLCISLYLLYIDYSYANKELNRYLTDFVNKINKGIVEILKIK